MPHKDPEKRREYVRERYRRIHNVKSPRLPLTATADERFDFYCCYTGSCIVWTACTMEFGHGQFVVNGKKVLAHRYSYERHYGPIPKELEIDHICRNPMCVAPGHLEAVTHAVNVQRGNAAEATRARFAKRSM